MNLGARERVTAMTNWSNRHAIKGMFESDFEKVARITLWKEALPK